MKHNFFRLIAKRQIALLGLFLMTGAAFAQSSKPAKPPVKATIPALLLSDIHFEPFWDPAKVAQLDAAPGAKWESILAPPASANRQQAFDAFLQKCNCSGGDTSSVLFDASLKAMMDNAPGAAFVTVSGDLISHDFRRKYFTLFPQDTPDDYRKFVNKTIEYVIGKLNAQFPKTPVYVALGNNDSDCDDYLIDAGNSFLKETGMEITKNFPAAERQEAQKTFADEGYYSVTLPAPIQNVRLLVLDDIFMAKNYATCSGKPDPKAADDQIAWLGKQLAAARANKQKLWVMGHIPPGVDLYSTMKRMGDVCGGQPPAMFLSSEKMADLLAGYGDVIELAIFAHTHMDELRLLKDDSQPLATQIPVPVKMVPSISPIHGNNPSFTVAQIDPSSAALVDYRVVSASNLTGVAAKWTEEYDFAKSYIEPEFTSSSVSQLIAAFAADPGAKTQASRNYIGDFSAGSYSSILQMFWPEYVCTLSNHTQKSFTACACSIAQ